LERGGRGSVNPLVQQPRLWRGKKGTVNPLAWILEEGDDQLTPLLINLCFGEAGEDQLPTSYPFILDFKKNKL
jgi:hypothetical protein